MSSSPTPQVRLLISVANELGRALDNIWGLRTASPASHQTPELSTMILDNTEVSLLNHWRLYHNHILATTHWTCAQLDQYLITPEYLGGSPQQPLPATSHPQQPPTIEDAPL